MPHCHIRLFTHPKSTWEEHSFLIGHGLGGLTDRLDSIHIDHTTTFRQLRLMIELKEERDMTRRTLLFQEILYLMQHAPNPYGYTKEDGCFSYRLGFMNEDGSGDVPSLISLEDEKEGRVLDFYKNLARQDVVIVPTSQIAPNGQCSPPSTALGR